MRQPRGKTRNVSDSKGARCGGAGIASRVAAALAVAVLVGCATTPTPQPTTQYPDYLAGAPDQLAVTILPEPLIQDTVVVRPDGKITVQLVGDVQAGGRTLPEIAEDIEKRIRKFKRGAVVTVQLMAAQSSSITVIGEVGSPAAFPLNKQMRVAEALGFVGDTTFLANDDEIRVVRAGNPTEVILVDLDAIRSGDLRTNVQLRGGDIVYVPPTAWARVGYVIQSVLFPIQPLLGVATSAAGSALVR